MCAVVQPHQKDKEEKEGDDILRNESAKRDHLATPFASGPWPRYRLSSIRHSIALALLPYRIFILTMLITGSAAVAVCYENLLKNREFFRWYSGWSSRTLLQKGLGFRIEILGGIPEIATVVVANHIAIWDVWALMAALESPLSFVARASLLHFPIVSSIMRALRTVGVDRRNGKDARIKVSQRLAQADAPWPMACFPEGATTNGIGLIDFKTGIFANECKTVTPVALRYICDSGFDLSYTSNQMSAAAVFKHFIRTLLEPQKKIQIIVLSPIHRSYNESNSDFASRVRRAIADAAQLQLWSGWDANRLRSAWYQSCSEHID